MGETGHVLAFSGALLIFSGIVAVGGIPLWLVASRLRRRLTLRNYAIAGAVVAVTSALVEVASDRAVAQCEAAGNPTCFDPGGTGLQLVMLAFYFIANWYVAFLLWKE